MYFSSNKYYVLFPPDFGNSTFSSQTHHCPERGGGPPSHQAGTQSVALFEPQDPLVDLDRSSKAPWGQRGGWGVLGSVRIVARGRRSVTPGIGQNGPDGGPRRPPCRCRSAHTEICLSNRRLHPNGTGPFEQALSHMWFNRFNGFFGLSFDDFFGCRLSSLPSGTSSLFKGGGDGAGFKPD